MTSHRVGRVGPFEAFDLLVAEHELLDATIVRCLLVPALMVKMGAANWYMPRWLDRLLPRVSIEGAEFFERRDRSPRDERQRELQPVLHA